MSYCSGHVLNLLRKGAKPFEAQTNDTLTIGSTDHNKSKYVTDLPFQDLIISPSGLMLSLMPIVPLPLPLAEGPELETEILDNGTA
jgi:hypothetical protein